MDNAGCFRGFEKSAGLGRSRRKRLVADDVFAVPQGGKNGRTMQVVWSCDVDYMNVRVPRKFLVALVDLWNAVSGRLLTYAFWLRRRDGRAL